MHCMDSSDIVIYDYMAITIPLNFLLFEEMVFSELAELLSSFQFK